MSDYDEYYGDEYADDDFVDPLQEDVDALRAEIEALLEEDAEAERLAAELAAAEWQAEQAEAAALENEREAFSDALGRLAHSLNRPLTGEQAQAIYDRLPDSGVYTPEDVSEAAQRAHIGSFAADVSKVNGASEARAQRGDYFNSRINELEDEAKELKLDSRFFTSSGGPQRAAYMNARLDNIERGELVWRNAPEDGDEGDA